MVAAQSSARRAASNGSGSDIETNSQDCPSMRLVVADEIELIEKELKEGRSKALVAPVMEFSDDDEPRHVDEDEPKAASALDVERAALQTGKSSQPRRTSAGAVASTV